MIDAAKTRALIQYLKRMGSLTLPEVFARGRMCIWFDNPKSNA